MALREASLGNRETPILSISCHFAGKVAGNEKEKSWAQSRLSVCQSFLEAGRRKQAGNSGHSHSAQIKLTTPLPPAQDYTGLFYLWGQVSCSSNWHQIHYVAKYNVGLLILLPLPPKCWNYRHGHPPMSVVCLFFFSVSIFMCVQSAHECACLHVCGYMYICMHVKA